MIKAISNNNNNNNMGGGGGDGAPADYGLFFKK